MREALGILVAEGLADRVPNKGTQVRRLDPDQVRDVCRARTVIETAGVRRWDEAERAGRATSVRRALAAYSELPRQRLHHAPSSPPPTSRSTAPSRRSPARPGWWPSAEALHSEVRLALAQVDRARGNAAEQVHSHSHLLDLMEAGDLDDAAAELTAHLAEAEESMVDEVRASRG